MRNLVIALIVSAVVVGGALFLVFGGKGAGRVVVPPETQDKIATTTPATPKGVRRVENVPATPRDKVRVEVVVTNDKDEPVANARVRIDSEEALKSGRRDIVAAAEFLTNSSGLGAPKDKLEVGTYVVWAEASGYARARQLVTLAKGAEPVKVSVVLSSGVAITGRVFAKDRTPIKGARVLAFKDLGKKDGTDFDWLMDLLEPKRLEKPLAMDETDANGSYQLSNLEKGIECVVRAAADGYAPGMRNFVAAGTPNVDFYLESGARILGEVVSANGAPVGGAKVEAYQRSGATSDIREAVANAMRGAVDTVTTGGDGRFEFAALGQGSFTLIASAAAHQEALKEIEVKLGQDVNVSMALEDGLVLAGTVMGPNGSPVPDAKVSVRPQASVSGGNNSINREVDKETTTDASGKFAFDCLSPGQCTVTVSHSELAAAQVRDVDVPQENLEITLTEGAAIEGKVTDTQGNPLAGVRVSVQDIGNVPKEAVTGEDGRYLLGPLSVKPINKKQVQAEKDGWSRGDPKSVTLTEGTVMEVDLTLSRIARVAGVVKDSGGKPIAGVKVLVEKMITKDNPVHRFLDFAYTKEDGKFELPRVAPSADVRLVAEHRYYIQWLSDPFNIEAGDELVDTEIQMEVGAKVTGEVVSDAGARLAGAQVKAVKVGDPDTHDFLGGSTARTDDQGRFEIQGLGSGNYEVVAQANGFLDGRSEPIELSEGASRSGIRVKLTAGRSVGGVVLDNHRKPIAGARITAIDASAGTRKESNVSDENGQWTVTNLGSEPVEIQAEAEGFNKQSLRDVPTGKADIEIQMLPLGGVKGIVLDSDNKPVKAFTARAEVIETDPGYEAPRSSSFKTFSNPDGSFELANLAPGSYTINAQSPGYRGTQANNIRVAAGEIVDVGTLKLQAGGLLHGRVIDLNGAPVPDATVTVIGGASRLSTSSGEKSETSVMTDGDGRFTFQNLKAGSMRFRATKAGFIPVDSELVDPNTLAGDLVLTLGVGGTIAGVVMDGRRRPLPNVKVYLKGEPRSAQTASDVQGRFSFPDLPAGTYTVRTFTFAKPGEERPQEAVLDVDVPVGGSVEVELVKE